ncbi:MAG: hypothetical protein LBJ02_06940 [Bifidobacteriaceae bacterium]|jgi:hypothetical protein|nr:hypothetical protein [Bifidobacteriaceae bacterium]
MTATNPTTATLRIHSETKARIAEMARRMKLSQADCVKELVDPAWRASGYRLPRQPKPADEPNG